MPKDFRPATGAEAVEGLKAVESARATIEASPITDLSRGLARPDAWGSIAYLSTCERAGSALRLSIDPSAFLEPDGSIELTGRAAMDMPWSMSAWFEVPAVGAYACTVRLRRTAPDGSFGFYINATDLGGLEIDPVRPTNYTFGVRLGQGKHAFTIQRRPGSSFLFYSVTVFHVPEVAPA